MPSSTSLIAQWLTANINQTEGSVTAEQIDWFFRFLNDPEGARVHEILEIGFNGGISAAAFLEGRKNTRVVSVDIGDHDYVLKAKRWLDNLYPGRHTLLIGDSKQVLPGLDHYFKDYHPDLIFVDGGHDRNTCVLDLQNAYKLAKPSTWIIVDDVMESEPGVLQALQECMKRQMFVVLGQYKTNLDKDRPAGSPGTRAWVVMKKIG